MKSESEIQQRARRVGVPDHLIDGLTNYILHGLPPGHFLSAVLANDLIQAMNRADDRSAAGLMALCRFVYYSMPAPSWGSPERVESWIRQGGIGGRDESTRAAAV